VGNKGSGCGLSGVGLCVGGHGNEALLGSM
jgi:hypothetical protein